MAKQKVFRVSEEVERKLRELVKIYNSKSENHCFELIVNDIYELKKSKALVPFEELNRRDQELKRVIYELGATKKELELLQKEKTEQKKGFWARLFGG